jgi:hypothetical protein
VWALSTLHSHSHYWLCYLGNHSHGYTILVPISHFQCHSVGLHSPVIYSSFISIFFSTRFLSSLDLNPLSELPIIKLIKICSIFLWWRKPECPEETTGTWSNVVLLLGRSASQLNLNFWSFHNLSSLASNALTVCAGSITELHQNTRLQM